MARSAPPRSAPLSSAPSHGLSEFGAELGQARLGWGGRFTIILYCGSLRCVLKSSVLGAANEATSPADIRSSACRSWQKHVADDTSRSADGASIRCHNRDKERRYPKPDQQQRRGGGRSKELSASAAVTHAGAFRHGSSPWDDALFVLFLLILVRRCQEVAVERLSFVPAASFVRGRLRQGKDRLVGSIQALIWVHPPEGIVWGMAEHSVLTRPCTLAAGQRASVPASMQELQRVGLPPELEGLMLLRVLLSDLDILPPDSLSIQYPVSSIQYPVSSVQYPVSSIQYPVSSIQYPVSDQSFRITDRRVSQELKHVVDPWMQRDRR
ncbi:hypothetical protein B2J93_2202 [Marssonina coronariae]|uniref:Uncharacterized protein n=1 Tax=Diplocarpon coronariae TaxID=2795749 RepID=A0A218Z7V7_9HELO|nr:hypothetical protein B2J93_2202 [Marssonina coronariae]